MAASIGHWVIHVSLACLVFDSPADAYRLKRGISLGSGAKGDKCYTVWDVKTGRGNTCGQLIESFTSKGMTSEKAKELVGILPECQPCGVKEREKAKPRRRSRKHRKERASRSSESKTYTCDSDQTRFTMTAVNGSMNKWFKRIFENAKPEELGVGQDVRTKRDPYTKLKFRTAWRISGENDVDRFNNAQEFAFAKNIAKFEQFLFEKPWRKREGGAREQTAQQMVWGVKKLNTALQQMRDYPEDDMDHPTIDELHGAVTYLLDGVKGDPTTSVFCTGLQGRKKGLFGEAVYLYDRAGKIDQFASGDCSKKRSNDDCVYVIDSVPSNSKPGFPKPIDLPNGNFDRSKPVHYGLVVLTSPFRIGRDFAVKNGKSGRRNERQLFFTPQSRTWEDYPFNHTLNSFQCPGPDKRPVFDKYQFIHALSKNNHPEVAAELSNREWYPILNRMDEYFLQNPAYTRVDYVVAYQRE